MSRSHRDQRNYYYKHFQCPHGYQWLCNCWPWDYMFYRFPPPSYWNRDIRRSERAFTRNRIQRARAGHRDWATVEERKGDEYYW